MADDVRRRYLAQQMELGGAEVVLPAGAARFARATTDRAASLDPAARRPDRASSSTPEGRPVSTAGIPDPAKYLKGLPPIPGPGLVIEPPVPDLMAGGPALDSLDAVAEAIAGCRKCPLCEGRTRTVPGEGVPTATLMCVGEGPGQTEDETGRPFVGAAGQLLDEILAAIGMSRQTNTFIANIVKCRPPQNRKPLPDEMAACLPYLHRQIALVRPRVILALGSTAAEGLLGSRKALGELRNRVHTYGGIPLVVTYHPAALLRNPAWKKPTWDDVRIARQLLDR